MIGREFWITIGPECIDCGMPSVHTTKPEGLKTIHVRKVDPNFDCAVEGLVVALKDANDKCRSAHEIALRNGEANWIAFENRLKETLEKQADALEAFEKANKEKE